MSSFQSPNRSEDARELQELWDSIPSSTLRPEVERDLPMRVVARLERAEQWRSRIRAGIVGLGAAAALLLLLRATEPPPGVGTESGAGLTGAVSSKPDDPAEISNASESLETSAPIVHESESEKRLAALPRAPGTRELLDLRRALNAALSGREQEEAEIMIRGLLEANQTDLSRAARQAWNAGFAQVLENYASSEEALVPVARWSGELEGALKEMSPEELDSFSRSDLDPQLLSVEAASLVGTQLARNDQTDRLFDLGMKFSAYEQPALRALEGEEGRAWLQKKLHRTSSRGSRLLLRAIAQVAPDSGVEYAERFVGRSSLREDALMAIAAYPAAVSFSRLLHYETRYGRDTVHAALAKILEREGQQVAAQGLPPDVRRQEEVVDALVAHETPHAERILLSWALRSSDSDCFLQKAERERLLLAASSWGVDSQRLRRAYVAIHAEDKSLAAALLVSISRADSAESAIDTALGGASRNTRLARELAALFGTNRRERPRGDAHLLLRLRRLLRDLPTPETDSLPDQIPPIDSMQLYSGFTS